MPHSFTTLCRCFVLLLAISLGACQRSSYSFQNTAATNYQALATPSPASAASATVVAVAQPLAPAEEASKARAVHVLRQRRVTSRQAVRRPMQSRLLAHLAIAAVRAPVARLRAPQEPLPAGMPERRRSRGIALLLAFFLGPIGAHLFYLGYHGRGMAYAAATAAAVLLVSIAFVGLIATLYGGGEGFLALAVIGTVLLTVVNALALVDAIRIVTGSLNPRNGEYYPRFFQSRP